MNSANSRLIAVMILWGTALMFGASANRASFPGTKYEVRSPDGRYSISDVHYKNTNQAYLLLIDRRTNKDKEIRDYQRHVEVLWSPASDAFVVNDHEGSDSTRPILYRLRLAASFWSSDTGFSGTDLLEGLTAFLHTQQHENLEVGNHHVYLTVQRWLNSEEVLCDLDGYGEFNPNGFKKRYVYKIGKGFRAYRP